MARKKLGATPVVEYTSNSGSVNVPAGVDGLWLTMIGAGGGGGSGYYGTTATTRFGGEGGQGGSTVRDMYIPATLLGATFTVTVSSSGGTGGTAMSTLNHVGNTGNTGGDTSFATNGFTWTASGGAGGAGGGTSLGTSSQKQATSAGPNDGRAGGLGQSGTGSNGGWGDGVVYGAAGGGGGGGLTSGNVRANGGSGGGNFILNISGGSAGVAGGASPTSGSTVSTGFLGVGGGGGAGATAAGMSGADAVGHGGGGGGGGASNTTNSGAGGKGAPGYCRIVWDYRSDRKQFGAAPYVEYSSCNSSLSWSHTVGASATILIVGITTSPTWDPNGAGFSYTSFTRTVTYNGVAMTSLGAIDSGHSSGYTSGFVEFFYLMSPATGTHTVSVTATGAANNYVETVVGNSVSYNGATGVGTPVITSGFGGTPTVTVSSSSSGRPVAVYCCGSAISTPNQTQRALDNYSNGTGAGNLLIEDANGAASVSLGFAATGDLWGVVAVNLTSGSSVTFDAVGGGSHQTGTYISGSVPSGIKGCWVYMIGLGGGGGSGATASTVQTAWGGQGGYGGNITFRWVPAALLGTTYSVTIPYIRFGGSGVSGTSVAGTAGLSMGQSIFSSGSFTIYCDGGQPGGAGNNGASPGISFPGMTQATNFFDIQGGDGAASMYTDSTTSSFLGGTPNGYNIENDSSGYQDYGGPAGGGAGGYVSNNSIFVGSGGGYTRVWGQAGGTGGTGVVAPTRGTAAVSGVPGVGAGGGAAQNTANGQNGANGIGYGSGGGGGGACVNGKTSGTGGNGGPGYVRIIWDYI